jgi:SNF2 family DNA or RNA helicase
MNIIHLFWQQTTTTFNNTGNLVLWIESDQVITKKTIYSYQLNEANLVDWLKTTVKGNYQFKKIKVKLPCDQENKEIPSPIIANLNNINDTQYTNNRIFELNAIVIDEPIKFLKDLNFQSYYFDEQCKLGDDAIFWINMAYELSYIIKHDQYIPSIIAAKSKKGIDYYSRWQPMSSAYNDRLNQAATYMPISACLGEFSSYDPSSVLHNFSEVSLTNFISHTVYPQKLYKMFEGTFIEQSLDCSKSYLSEEMWKDWKLWQNNLAYDQFGSPFQICFRLNSAQNEEGEGWSLETLLQSKEDPSFMINLNQYWCEKETKQKLFTKMLGTSIERTLLLQIGYATRIYPVLEQIFEQNMQITELTLDTGAAFQFLKEDAWSLHACGYRIIVPSWWTTKGRLKAKVKMRASKTKTTGADSPTSFFHKDGLVNFNYRYAIGEHDISDHEWQQLIEAKSELVYFRGSWIEIDIAEMQKMQQLIETSQKDKNVGNMKDLLMMSADDELYEIEFDQAIETMLSQLKNKDKLDLVLQPENLQATLRPYQNRGLSWLAYLEKLGMSPCLADDMGLGKTMQVISLLLAHPREKTALLIAPTSVIGNWQREIQKFAPSLKAVVHHGGERKKKGDFDKLVEQYDLIITSYGLIRRDKDLFNKHKWSRLIIDEAQNIKNPDATQTKILYKIPADFRIAMTGTPIENRLMDLWSIFNFLNPGFLGTRSLFRKCFELPIQRNNNERQTKVLKSLVEPFILRRLKTDKNIIHDLPDKIEQKVYCELTKEQASIYQSIVDEIEDKMANAEDKGEQNTIILSALLRLKQCCNHPAQVLQDGSEFTLERSVKLQRLTEMTKEVIDNGESILIFSQFKEICGALNTLLKTKFGYNTFYLHGGTIRKKREEMIEQFQAPGSPPSIFILSLKAGGVGITLTKANHVIHFDRWWNPAVENQATDRAYRIGQQKTVFAHKYITMGTIEERIDNMLESKQKMSDSIVGNDESWLSQLDAKSFMKLIRLSQSSMETIQAEDGKEEYADEYA